MLKKFKGLKIVLAVFTSVCVTAGMAVMLMTAGCKSKKVTPAPEPEPTRVTCEVTKNENVYGITNTGNVNAYVRVAVIANYVDGATEGDGASYWTTPEYTVTLADESKWVKYGNYYYCMVSVEPENTADEDAESIQFGTVTVTSTSPSGYAPQVEVIANVIQATAEELSSCWGVSFTESGVAPIQ